MHNRIVSMEIGELKARAALHRRLNRMEVAISNIALNIQVRR